MRAKPEPPPWGEMLRKRREALGWSVLRAAQRADDVSDSYWGGVEKGWQSSRNADGWRPIKPSRAMLITMADALDMTTNDTDRLLRSADYPSLRGHGEHDPAPNAIVDLTGLSKNDIGLLNAIADRFRASRVADNVTPLRRAARRGKPEEQDPTRSGD